MTDKTNMNIVSKDTLVPASIIIAAILMTAQMTAVITRLSSKVDQNYEINTETKNDVASLRVEIRSLREDRTEEARRDVAIEMRVEMLEDKVDKIEPS